MYRYGEQFKITGEVQKSVQRNGPLWELSEHEELFIVNLALTTPGIYLREIQQELQQHLHIWIDLSTICRTLKRLGMTRQKIKHVALQESKQKQIEFIAEMQVLDPSLLALAISATALVRPVIDVPCFSCPQPVNAGMPVGSSCDLYTCR